MHANVRWLGGGQQVVAAVAAVAVIAVLWTPGLALLECSRALERARSFRPYGQACPSC